MHLFGSVYSAAGLLWQAFGSLISEVGSPDFILLVRRLWLPPDFAGLVVSLRIAHIYTRAARPNHALVLTSLGLDALFWWHNRGAALCDVGAKIGRDSCRQSLQCEGSGRYQLAQVQMKVRGDAQSQMEY